MPLYSGVAYAEIVYTVTADDKEQAHDFIFDMAEDDFEDAYIEVKTIEEVK